MSALGDNLKALITRDGPIPFERFMGIALGDPDHGYYQVRDPLGADGDFTTSPEISQMFGELIGLWAAEVWQFMGCPNPVRFIELGPGHGTLMSDALRATRVTPEFRAALDVWLVETSPVLAETQHETLLTCGVAVSWTADIADTPAGPAIIIGNEFLDALPLRQYVRTRADWRERLVALDERGEFVFSLAKIPEMSIRAFAPEGAVIEVNPAAHRLVFDVGSRLAKNGGAALFVDYGYNTTSFGETLQALRAHRHVAPLSAPGLSDLTAHVDFAAMARSASAAGAAVYGPLDQGDFLRNIGIMQRAEVLIARAAAGQQSEIESGRDRLIGKGQGEMGSLFKAMAIANRNLTTLPGFQKPESEA